MLGFLFRGFVLGTGCNMYTNLCQALLQWSDHKTAVIGISLSALAGFVHSTWITTGKAD